MNILIQWNEDFSVNVKEIDQQHKKLFDLINLLYDSYIRKENEDLVEQILSDLTDYVFVHFKNEEAHFIETNYEDTANHIAEHQFFLKQINKFQGEYQAHNPDFLEGIIAFLQGWISTHILETDKKYMESFKRAGLK